MSRPNEDNEDDAHANLAALRAEVQRQEQLLTALRHRQTLRHSLALRLREAMHGSEPAAYQDLETDAQELLDDIVRRGQQAEEQQAVPRAEEEAPAGAGGPTLVFSAEAERQLMAVQEEAMDAHVSMAQLLRHSDDDDDEEQGEQRGSRGQSRVRRKRKARARQQHVDPLDGMGAEAPAGTTPAPALSREDAVHRDTVMEVLGKFDFNKRGGERRTAGGPAQTPAWLLDEWEAADAPAAEAEAAAASRAASEAYSHDFEDAEAESSAAISRGASPPSSSSSPSTSPSSSSPSSPSASSRSLSAQVAHDEQSDGEKEHNGHHEAGAEAKETPELPALHAEETVAPSPV